MVMVMNLLVLGELMLVLLMRPAMVRVLRRRGKMVVVWFDVLVVLIITKTQVQLKLFVGASSWLRCVAVQVRATSSQMRWLPLMSHLLDVE